MHVMIYHSVPNRDLLAAETMSRSFLLFHGWQQLIFQKLENNLKNLKNFTWLYR